MKLYAAFAIGLGVACSGAPSSDPPSPSARETPVAHEARDNKSSFLPTAEEDSGSLGWGAPGPNHPAPREEQQR